MPLTKTEIKHIAQDELMACVESAWLSVADDSRYSDSEKEEIYSQLKKQKNRMLKLFGYDQE